MFFEVHRLGIFTPRSLDIDVVYDVMIHDLDILAVIARRRTRSGFESGWNTRHNGQGGYRAHAPGICDWHGCKSYG